MPPASLSAKPLISPGPSAVRKASLGSRERTSHRRDGARPGARRRLTRGFRFNMDLSVSSGRAGANLPIAFSGTTGTDARTEDVTPRCRLRGRSDAAHAADPAHWRIVGRLRIFPGAGPGLAGPSR